MLSHGDTAGVCDAAMEKVPAEIVEAQSADVDVVTGATFTSKGIMAAVKNALGLEEKTEQACPITDPDVLVIGAGVAGMRTAIEACRNGANGVILDKTDTVGGPWQAAGRSGHHRRSRAAGGGCTPPERGLSHPLPRR